MPKNKINKEQNKEAPAVQKHEIREGQSVELLKELHILTRDGKLNQDSRRKLKQIYHLYQFIEPLLNDILSIKESVSLVDHGAGKSYLGFILYDLFFKNHLGHSQIIGIETREELVLKSRELASRLGFTGMTFLNLSVAESTESSLLPEHIDIITALHACNTATDDAIDFALAKKAKYIILVPCCQAEVATVLKKNRSQMIKTSNLAHLWYHPLHAREFGSHLTNVLRSLKLEAHGYSVTVTELVGFEHSMKNELIIAKYTGKKNIASGNSLNLLIKDLGLDEIRGRFISN